jgi:hypothetical protein
MILEKGGGYIKGILKEIGVCERRRFVSQISKEERSVEAYYKLSTNLC